MSNWPDEQNNIYSFLRHSLEKSKTYDVVLETIINRMENIETIVNRMEAKKEYAVGILLQVVMQDKTETTIDELPSTLTVRDVATYLGISKATIDRRISTGKLKSYKDGKLRRIKREDLLEYIEALENK
ncbi:helix-turn-helix domain-containing protein [Paenibacillus sp. FSL H7-0331]|uniref:helix-turn-helix domain-containing protein n=1 Tax=Paenibacillus sp. FSL H7-0331 TaxID=1920421 RepID=UPI00097B67FF|nr:helix-turn-helix domain-containing protein [Paenibacillus sp. FSL H7-0331]OMF06810.1 hypothetical protein BK127_30895 [Paenibacillus sp. FSL H7-0331]